MAVSKKPPLLDYTSYRDLLRDYVHESKAQSKTWSYAGWARRMDLPSKSSLVMIVHGTRNPGPSLVGKFCEFFRFTNDEAKYFKKLVESEKKFLDPVSRLVFLRSNEAPQATDVRMRRQWLSFLLLDLAEIPEFKADSRWIRDQIRLPVDEIEISEVFELLMADGFLIKSEGGRLRRDNAAIEAKAGGPLTEKEIIRFHQDGALASLEALLKSKQEEREFRTSILRVSKRQLAEAKEILAETQARLSQLLQTSDADSIYELHLHLFPLTKP